MFDFLACSKKYAYGMENLSGSGRYGTTTSTNRMSYAVIDPAGKYLYGVINGNTAQTIEVCSIDQSDGTLSYIRSYSSTAASAWNPVIAKVAQ